MMTDAQNAVLLALRNHWAEEGYCPSLVELAGITKLSATRVHRALHQLEEMGHIRRFQNYRGWKLV
jgi:DNA-binding MarR family transcriptional regulator